MFLSFDWVKRENIAIYLMKVRGSLRYANFLSISSVGFNEDLILATLGWKVFFETQIVVEKPLETFVSTNINRQRSIDPRAICAPDWVSV